MTNSNFKKDLEEGQAVEVEVAELLKKIHPETVIEFNNARDLRTLREYDFIATDSKNESFKIEVKHDKLAEKTGNIAVENRCLAHTTAQLYIYKAVGTYYMISTGKLKNLCNMFRYSAVNGGDGGRSLLYLIPITYFAKEAKELRKI